MKIVNWILNALKWIKESIEVIKWVILAFGIITSLGWLKTCSNKSEQIDNLTTILEDKQIQIKTNSKRFAIESEIWNTERSQLKKEISEKEAKTSRYFNELQKAKQTIDDLNLKLKNVQNYQNTDIESKDSIRTEIVFINCDQIKIKPIEKKHIKIDFIQDNEYLDVKYKYNASITTIVDKKPKLKENGNKHFPNWGFIWGWEYFSNTTIDDPNAIITNNVNINFK